MATSDPLFDSFAAAVQKARLTAAGIDLHALYPAKILTGDGNKVSVEPDDKVRLGASLSNRPIKRPDGWTSKPVKGMRCYIGWEGGQADKPFVLMGWSAEGAKPTETAIEVASGNGALFLGDKATAKTLFNQTGADALKQVVDAINTAMPLIGTALTAISAVPLLAGTAASSTAANVGCLAAKAKCTAYTAAATQYLTKITKAG